jgi:acylphosphatase
MNDKSGASERYDTAQSSFKAIVKGRVQGVGFRAYVRQKAEEAGAAGFVRNMASGNEVEVQAEGTRTALEKLVGELHNGPRAAKVERVKTVWSTYTGQFKGFEIRL